MKTSPATRAAGIFMGGGTTKDPLLVASVGIADPSQAQDDSTLARSGDRRCARHPDERPDDGGRARGAAARHAFGSTDARAGSGPGAAAVQRAVGSGLQLLAR